MPNTVDLLDGNNIPDGLKDLLRDKNKLGTFIKDAGRTMAGFREMPESILYEGTLHEILFKMGVDPFKLPQNNRDWQDLAYRFQALARMLIDVEDRKDVSPPLSKAIYDKLKNLKMESPEKFPKEGTLDFLQFSVAEIYSEGRSATLEEKAAAIAALKELPKEFAGMGFCGFGLALLAATDPGMAQRAVWQLNAILVAERIVTAPLLPGVPPTPTHDRKPGAQFG